MTHTKSASLSVLLALILLLTTTPLFAKETPVIIDWPSVGAPVVRFSFGKFKQTSEINGQRNYLLDTTAQNLSNKPIHDAQFILYVFDKNKVRIGENTMSLTNVAPGETVKFQSDVVASGDARYDDHPGSVICCKTDHNDGQFHTPGSHAQSRRH